MTDITIGGLSRRGGCKVETIRYYEREGLLPAPPRTAGGHRVYAAAHLERLVFIRRGRELGFSLDQVRQLLRLVDGGTSGCSEARELTSAHLADVRGKIADLRRLEDVLATVVAQCRGGDAPDCPVIEALAGGVGFHLAATS